VGSHLAMRLLLVHADEMSFEAQRPALKVPPPLPPGEERGSAAEVLVVFYTIEAQDTEDPESVLAQAVENVRDVLRQVGAHEVLLYPYAHLSNQLAPPEKAREMGERLREISRSRLGVPVKWAPFGYYKSFTLKAKGHPLAELSRAIGPGSPPNAGSAKGKTAPVVAAPTESAAVAREKRLVSHWYVLTPSGDLLDADQYDFSKDPEFHAFYRYETQGNRAATDEPPHVRMMREMELVDYEPGADSGNFRWYPKGFLVKRLLETHASRLIQARGGMWVETPIMYDFEHPALKKYLDRFPARQYILRSEDREYFLRFAACFGQYLIFHDMGMSRKDLPVRLYELARFAFRREQTGELSGLRRLRTFTMPDMHTVVADMDDAQAEFLAQFHACQTWMADLEIPYHAAVRFVREFYDAHTEFAQRLARSMGKPILVEMWDERFFYFVMKFEFHPLDSQGRAAALSTVQIDVENCERFGIQYTDSDGQKKTPLLLHASIPGAIERNLYALLETEARRMARGEKGRFPFWLAPTQVRILPVSDPFREAALDLADRLESATSARVDVDDREEGIGRKIRDAEKEWVPLVLVYGEKEAGSDRLSLRRRDGTRGEPTFEELAREIRERQGDHPQAPLPLPRRIRMRPTFRG
jgi:threonyl-tRNA synthetase